MGTERQATENWNALNAAAWQSKRDEVLNFFNFLAI